MTGGGADLIPSGGHFYNLYRITVPSNLIPIVALTQSIENKVT